MLIAFEGPHGTGKTYGADKLSGGAALHNIDEATYRLAQPMYDQEKGVVTCFDQVGWISHMVDRLARPASHPWGQGHPGFTVFAMPDTHLVIKLFDRYSAPGSLPDKGYASGEPDAVNTAYAYQAHNLMAMNEASGYSLFKTITLLGNYKDKLSGQSRLRVIEFSSPLHPWWGSAQTRLVNDDLSLLDLLMVEEASR